MAKKRNRNQKKPQTPNTSKSSATAPDNDASSAENEAVAEPSPSAGSQNDAVESGDGEEDQVVEKDGKRKPRTKGEPKNPSTIKKRKSEKDDAKSNKGKGKSKKEDDDGGESDAEEKSEQPLYTFPMNRVSRIIRSENPDIRISQEAVFLINRASEKFLQVFCREAYACLFLEGKSYSAYNHLSSVVAKRKRFGFLSDFVPEKVKAEDALAQTPEAEI